MLSATAAADDLDTMCQHLTLPSSCQLISSLQVVHRPYSQPCICLTVAAVGVVGAAAAVAEATKRGLGAALLRRPTKLAKMVAGIVSKVDLPVTVKIRTGEIPATASGDWLLQL